MSSSRPSREIKLRISMDLWDLCRPWWLKRFDNICKSIGEGLIFGSLLGTVFDFFKGVFKAPRGKRLSGGFDSVQKNGIFHHGPVFATHLAAISFFECVIPNAVLTWAVSFAVVRLIHTSSARSAIAGGILGASLSLAMTLMIEDDDDDMTTELTLGTN